MIPGSSSFWTSDNRLPARGWGLRQKRCLPFLLRGLSASLSLRHSVSLTCQVWNQLRIELPRSRTPLLAFVPTNGLAIAKLEKANIPTVVARNGALLSDYTSYRLDSIRAVWHARLANAGAIDALERKVCQGVKL